MNCRDLLRWQTVATVVYNSCTIVSLIMCPSNSAPKFIFLNQQFLMLCHSLKTQFLLLCQIAGRLLDPKYTMAALCAEPYWTTKLSNASSNRPIIYIHVYNIRTMIATRVRRLACLRVDRYILAFIVQSRLCGVKSTAAIWLSPYQHNNEEHWSAKPSAQLHITPRFWT